MKINDLIGQEAAKRRLLRLAWNCRERPHELADSLMFLGPPSTGKTVSARAFCEEAGIPMLELQPQEILRESDLMDRIAKFRPDCDRIGIFIDECHQLPKRIEQCLLKALEPNDRLLVDENGRTLDTRQFVFLFATTDRGDLFDALDTRTVKIRLEMYSRREVAQIVNLNYPHWPFSVCELVAKYAGMIPREALAFARDMLIEYRMLEHSGEKVSIAEIGRRIAVDHGIDEHGLTSQRLDILTALGQAPVSRKRLEAIAGCKDAELQKFTLPPLLAKTPDRPQPLMTVSSKGYAITPAGLAELDLRDIPNQGEQAIPKSIRTLFPIDDGEDNGAPAIREFRRMA